MAEAASETVSESPQARFADPARLASASGRLSDRGIDPEQVIGEGEAGEAIRVAGFYEMLGAVAATEKSGQSPTYAMARLALEAGLDGEIADTLYMAYTQQSAEEAAHGDKVFGNAYYAMGGHAPDLGNSAVGTQTPSFLSITDDAKQNKKRLGGMAGLLGGIETVALQRVFPAVVAMCERWDHPVGRDLVRQIEDNVRPEESRHVLTWRYVFHTMIAPKGDRVIDAYLEATNTGRRQLGSPPLPREALERMLGSGPPTRRQLLGKDRLAFD